MPSASIGRSSPLTSSQRASKTYNFWIPRPQTPRRLRFSEVNAAYRKFLTLVRHDHVPIPAERRPMWPLPNHFATAMSSRPAGPDPLSGPIFRPSSPGDREALRPRQLRSPGLHSPRGALVSHFVLVNQAICLTAANYT